MRVRVEGHSSQAPLVFIHGAGGSALTWLELFRHFERTRRVVAPDLPGHGQSEPWPDCGERIVHYRDAVGAACAELELGRAILIGHSLGGIVALAAAAAWPDKVAGVVVLDAAADMKPTPALLDALRARPDRQAELLAELGWSPATPRDTVLRWFRSVTSAEPAVTLADLEAVAAFDTAAILPSVRARVLAIGGEDDLLCPPAAVQRLAAALPSAEAALLPDVGHHAHLERPLETIKLIERFLTFV